MAALKSIYALHEVVTDENGDYIREYDKDLPHSDEIAEIFIREWNGFAGEMLKIKRRSWSRSKRRKGSNSGATYVKISSILCHHNFPMAGEKVSSKSSGSRKTAPAII